MNLTPRGPGDQFSGAEMRRRRALLDGVATEHGVDHVLVYGANRSGSAVQWLTGWPVTREAVAVHTVGAPDTLLVHFYNHVPQARLLATEADVRWAGEPTIATVVAELRERGAGPRTRVGVVGALPLSAGRTLDEAFGDVIDLNAGYTGLRLVKSPEEIAVLRLAAQLTDLSCAALGDGLRPGMSDYQLGALVEGAYLGRGGANYIHYFAITSMTEPDQCVPAQWPTGRRVEPGDLLACELSTSVGVDYPGQLLRTFTVGAEPTQLVRRLHETADEALDRIESVLAPGTTPEQIVEAASVIEAEGFTTVDDLVHGLGGGYLPPVFGSRSRTLTPLPSMSFRAGMTVVVQPNVTTADGRIGVQTGELMHVTETGCERLHSFPRGLGRLG